MLKRCFRAPSSALSIAGGLALCLFAVAAIGRPALAADTLLPTGQLLSPLVDYAAGLLASGVAAGFAYLVNRFGGFLGAGRQKALNEHLHAGIDRLVAGMVPAVKERINAGLPAVDVKSEAVKRLVVDVQDVLGGTARRLGATPAQLEKVLTYRLEARLGADIDGDGRVGNPGKG